MQFISFTLFVSVAVSIVGFVKDLCDVLIVVVSDACESGAEDLPALIAFVFNIFLILLFLEWLNTIPLARLPQMISRMS